MFINFSMLCSTIQRPGERRTRSAIPVSGLADSPFSCTADRELSRDAGDERVRPPGGALPPRLHFRAGGRLAPREGGRARARGQRISPLLPPPPALHHRRLPRAGPPVRPAEVGISL